MLRGMERLNDCFAAGDRLLTVGEAAERLRTRLGPAVGRERVPLAEARGRILAEPLVSGFDVPGYDNAAVDGYAYAHGQQRYRIAGRAAAGRPFPHTLKAGEAVRILTGAPVPQGADTVAMQEDCRLDGETVSIPANLKAGANYRRAGENIRRGETVFEAGQRLGPLQLGVAASLGETALEVFRPLRVALFSTGDELALPGDKLAPGQLYDSNRTMLRAFLEADGIAVTDLGILADHAPSVKAALAEAAAGHDVVMTSAGISTGDEDHVAAAVPELHFWRLAVKPGRPLALGSIGSAAFVGLPGNPVAAAACLLMLVRPMLGLLGGAGWEAPPATLVPAGFAMKKKTGRREWLRVSLGEDGAARKAGPDGSALLRVMAEADGLLDVPEDVAAIAPGDRFPMFRL
ncbi:MAG: molybdopterin molybdotransferase MoeA [Rhodospirillaceae bacterium]|nr:molybdopterin molybdotransferase MoeA [Rhodospirillaceae bacterium]